MSEPQVPDEIRDAIFDVLLSGQQQGLSGTEDIAPEIGVFRGGNAEAARAVEACISTVAAAIERARTEAVEAAVTMIEERARIEYEEAEKCAFDKRWGHGHAGNVLIRLTTWLLPPSGGEEAE